MQLVKVSDLGLDQVKSILIDEFGCDLSWSDVGPLITEYSIFFEKGVWGSDKPVFAVCKLNNKTGRKYGGQDHIEAVARALIAETQGDFINI